MPKHIFLSLVLLLACLTALAQNSSYIQRPAIGLHASFLDFKGADSLKGFGRNMQTGLSLHFQNSFSPRVAYSITVTGSFLNFVNQHNNSLGNGKEELLLETDFSIQGRIVSPNSRIIPYVQAGAGFSRYKSYYGIFVPAGVGVQVNLSEDIFLLINSQYRLPVTETQHRHFYHSIGLAGAIGKKKKVKTIPPPPVPVKRAPVLDTDGDGIVDSLDACVTSIGLARYNGCPVPDRDKDGINDENDQCPDAPGIVRYKGCPVPDKDKDGLHDEEDACPDNPGPVSNRGCPVITDTIQSIIAEAAKMIFFETGSYTLLSASYQSLDKVALFLEEYPQLLITIEGHTDNVGATEDNRLLSENRAKAVMNYFIEKGILKDRLKAKGYGELRPVASNATAAGRAKNRRVELLVGRKQEAGSED